MVDKLSGTLLPAEVSKVGHTWLSSQLHLYCVSMTHVSGQAHTSGQGHTYLWAVTDVVVDHTKHVVGHTKWCSSYVSVLFLVVSTINWSSLWGRSKESEV